MGYVPYRLLNRSELSHIETSIRTACASWASAWLGEEHACDVHCHRAAEFDNVSIRSEGLWLAAGATDGAWSAIAYSDSFVAQFGAALVNAGAAGAPQGEAKNSPLLRELALTALTELPKAVSSGMDASTARETKPPNGPDDGFWKTGSGAAIVDIVCSNAGFILALNPPLVEAILHGISRKPGHKTALDNAADALNKHRLQLQVRVGEAELELGLLQTIAVGDVVRLDTRVDQLLHVVNADGDRLCGAYLGTQGGRKSIQLTK